MDAIVVNGKVVQVLGNAPYLFSETVFQTASSLTEDQRREFSVFPLVEVEDPVDYTTQARGEFVDTFDGAVVTRRWPAIALTEAQIKQARNGKILRDIEALEQEAIASGLIRTAIEQLILLVPTGTVAYAKLVANDKARAELRKTLIK